MAPQLLADPERAGMVKTHRCDPRNKQLVVVVSHTWWFGRPSGNQTQQCEIPLNATSKSIQIHANPL